MNTLIDKGDLEAIIAQAEAEAAKLKEQNERAKENEKHSREQAKKDREAAKQQEEAARLAKIEAEKKDKYATLMHLRDKFLFDAGVMEAFKKFIQANEALDSPWDLKDVRITLNFGKTNDSPGYSIFMQNSTAKERFHQPEIERGGGSVI